MKKTFLISAFGGLIIVLSACSQQLIPADNQKLNNKISELKQQINQMKERNQELTHEISNLQDQSQNNIDLENQLDELKKQLEQIENAENETVDVSEPHISYQEIIKYVDNNITTIINSSFLQKPANGNWFADGYGFTSLDHFYVDFEDGHFLYRALLQCNIIQNNIDSCKTLAIFENQKEWIVIQGEDTQKNNPILYTWAKDYEWQR